MPKFYVQSGTLRLITTATDPRAAAIWAVHRALVSSVPFLSEAEPGDPSCASAGRAVLGETIHVSERGFDRSDDQSFETLAVVTEWSQLLLAVDRLQKRLAST